MCLRGQWGFREGLGGQNWVTRVGTHCHEIAVPAWSYYYRKGYVNKTGTHTLPHPAAFGSLQH